MTENKTKLNRRFYPLALLIGLLNGLFGAGGGIIAVPMLRGLGLRPEEAHATSMAVILPLALASGFLYLRAAELSFAEAWPYLPGGLLGAAAGAWLLSKLKTVWLHRLFGAAILFAAGRLLLG